MPLAAKKPCNRHGCPKLTSRRYCEDHTDVSREHDKWRGNASSRGYGSDWKRVRMQVLKRDKFLCLICLAAGRVTAALDVDHIIPISIAPERRLDTTNCQSLCRACHRIKTSAEQRNP